MCNDVITVLCHLISVIAIITIAAGVGVPLLITIIVMIIVWKRVTKRTLKEKHKRLSG